MIKQVGNSKLCAEQRSAINRVAYFWIIKRDYVFDYLVIRSCLPKEKKKKKKDNFQCLKESACKK